MKKNKIILSAVLAALLTTGAGYAAWTDNLNITASASTGELKVEFVGPKEIELDGLLFDRGETVPWSSRVLESGNKNYSTSTLIKNNSNNATFTLSGMYPGSGALYALGFENKSTIPVKISSVTISNINSKLADNAIAISGYRQYRKDGRNEYKLVSSDVLSRIKDLSDYSEEALMTMPMPRLRDLQSGLNSMLGGITMQPGDIITLDVPEEYKGAVDKVLKSQGISGYNPVNDNCVIIGLPYTVSDNSLEKLTDTFTVTINVKQFNQ